MLLALDTATDRASIVLGTPTAVFARESIVGSRRHAAGLLPAVQSCLQQAGATVASLTGIILADGPGSFTGLRVSATVAKALVRVNPVPIRVAPSLLACALGVAGASGGPVVAVSDALRGELFAAGYRIEPGRLTTLFGPAALRPAEILAAASSSARFCGPAAPKFGFEPTWPDAAELLRLAASADGLRLVADPAAWEPEYGRPAEAQAKWEREHGRPLDHSTGIPR